MPRVAYSINGYPLDAGETLRVGCVWVDGDHLFIRVIVGDIVNYQLGFGEGVNRLVKIESLQPAPSEKKK